jgi:hypothetical protein
MRDLLGQVVEVGRPAEGTGFVGQFRGEVGAEVVGSDEGSAVF